MGNLVISGSNRVSITPDRIQVNLPDTEVSFEYDTATHTITLAGASLQHITGNDVEDVILLRQVKGLKQEIVLLPPDWR